MTSPNYAENNSVENIETKISNMISRLKMRNASFFHKVLLRLICSGVFNGYCKRHATNFGVLATFQRTTYDQMWPTKVNVKEDLRPKHIVLLFEPGGWKAFVVDNDIQVGIAMQGLSIAPTKSKGIIH